MIGTRTSYSIASISRFTAAVIIMWSLVVAGSYLWNAKDERAATISLAKKEALVTYNKDQAFRLWAMKHGGIYVPATDDTPPDPYLSHVPDRDIQHPSGRKLTLMNPAYALKQLMHDFEQIYGTKGHITSLKPLNPANAPDVWEMKALLRFGQGAEEVSEVTVVDGKDHLRLIRPMITKKGCLKCHAAQGYKEGDIRGGVSVAIPLEPFLLAEQKVLRNLLLSHGVIWLIGVGGVGFVYSRSKKNILERAKTEESIRENKEKFRNLVESTNDFVWEVDLQGRWTYLSPKIRDILGFEPEELLGKSSLDLMPGEEARRIADLFGPSSALPQPFSCVESINLNKQSDQVILECSGAPFFDTGGSLHGYRGIARDITQRKRTEGENRRLRDFFENIAESIVTGVWVSDREDVIFYANKAAGIIAGVEAARLVGAHVLKDFPERSQQVFAPLYLKAKETLRPVRFDALRLLTPAGRATFQSGWLIPRKLDGQYDGMIGTMEDVTERMRAEERIIRIVEAIPDMLFVIDRDGVFIDFHAPSFNDLYIPPEKIIGGNIREFFDAPLSGRMLDAINTALRTLRSATIQYALPMPGGVQHYEAVVAVYGVNEVIVVARNITDRKRVEEELRKTNELLEKVFSAGHIMIAYMDHDFNFIRVNEAYASSSEGKTTDFFVGKNHFALYPHQENERTFRSVVETGLPYHAYEKPFEYAGHPERGVTFWDWSLQPVKGPDGSVEGLVLILQDVTERRSSAEEKEKLEHQLRQAQKMEAIGALAGGVAHDFNNILTAIIGYANILKMKTKQDDPLRTFVDPILTSSERAAHLTQSLLAFSRKQFINPKAVSLNYVVRSVEKLLRHLISEDIELHIMLSDLDLVIMADAGQIEQVLMNLVTNARDAMPDGGILTISTQDMVLDENFMKTHGYGGQGRYAQLAVSDTGIGMDAQTKEKIFEPFFTTKELGRGTGLGLAIVYGIIRQHAGNISVYSEPGKGSTFKIYLPLVSVSPEESPAAPMALTQSGSETILLAEDDDAVRNLTRIVLQDFGYRIIEAMDGQDAIDKYQKRASEIDLVILDVIMPKKSGNEVYDAIKSYKPSVKVLFTSGYTADVIHKKGIFETGLQFISKPVSPSDLLRKIREILDSRP